jgi:hypothetical protein
MATTATVLECIASTRPTLTPPMVQDFEGDIERYARI